MAVNLLPDGTVQLVGECPLEDAEKLLQALISRPAATVDWRQCSAAHTAVVQVLIAAKHPLSGPPGGEWLRHFIEPRLLSEERSTDPGGERG